MDILPVAKAIKMSCMRKGIVSYPETNEAILIEHKVLEQMAKSAHGIPVVISHPGIKIDHETIKTIPIHGRVSGMTYNPDDDEWYADFTVHSQEASDLLQKGYGISTGWYPKQYGPPGTYNGVPYTDALVDGRYEHLAIVRTPRYEMAKNPIYLNSASAPCKEVAQPANIDTKQSTQESKPVGRIPMKFNLFRNKREEIKVNEGEEMMVNMGESGDCKLSELVEMYKKSTAPAAAPEVKKNMAGDDDMVDLGEGKSISVKEMKAAVAGRKDASASTSVTDAGDRSAEDVGFKVQDVNDTASVADAVKGNEAADEGEGKGEEVPAKTNANFEQLRDLHENGVAEEQEEAWLSTHKRVEMGRLRYGSPTK